MNFNHFSNKYARLCKSPWWFVTVIIILELLIILDFDKSPVRHNFEVKATVSSRKTHSTLCRVSHNSN